MSAPDLSGNLRTSDLGGAFARNLTQQQTHLLNELTLSAHSAANYQDLFSLTVGFFEQISAGAINCAIFDNGDFSLVGFSTSMRDAPLDQIESEEIGQFDPLLGRIERSSNPAVVGFGLGITADWSTDNCVRLVQILEQHGYFGLLFIPVRIEGGPFSAAITIATELTPDEAFAYLELNCIFMLMAARTLGARATQLFQPGDIDKSWRPRRSALLTGRELQVVEALSKGDRPEQIAHDMSIKPVTVHMHVASARQKLGARTREQLVSLALKQGLV